MEHGTLQTPRSSKFATITVRRHIPPQPVTHVLAHVLEDKKGSSKRALQINLVECNSACPLVGLLGLCVCVCVCVCVPGVRVFSVFTLQWPSLVPRPLFPVFWKKGPV